MDEKFILYFFIILNEETGLHEEFEWVKGLHVEFYRKFKKI